MSDIMLVNFIHLEMGIAAWVYDHYKYFTFSTGTDLRLQNLTFIDVMFWFMNRVFALKRLIQKNYSLFECCIFPYHLFMLFQLHLNTYDIGLRLL